MPEDVSGDRAKPMRPTVLVVDDDPTVLDALESLLSPRLEPLYRVEMAASAEEALEIVGQATEGESPVALVISDERMPGRSGTDLLVALRQHKAHRDGGRIIVTAYAGLASAQRAINEAEVDRYYPKPWDADQNLLPAIGSILARFAEARGFDRYLVAKPADGPVDLEDVIRVRRAWWEYLNLFDPDIEDSEIAVPSFADPLDEQSDVLLVHRITPRETSAVGTMRLRPGATAEWKILDGLAFLPEEAGDELEQLMIQSLAIGAVTGSVTAIRTQAPLLRREVYESVGFDELESPGEPAAPGAVWMDLDPSRLKAPESYVARYRAERRLCACMQSTCPKHDYAGSKRNYFCPLDIHEGRLPHGFPSAAAE